MENIVVSTRAFNGYLVKYPYSEHLDFVATSYKALKDGLKATKASHKPVIYFIEAWSYRPKFRKLTNLQIKTIQEDLIK
jgi:hypothetical protein